MIPVDPIDAFMWMAALVVMFGVPLFGLLAACEWLVGRLNEKPLMPVRRTERVPSEELDLLGDDWRDCVAHLFRDNTGEAK